MISKNLKILYILISQVSTIRCRPVMERANTADLPPDPNKNIPAIVAYFFILFVGETSFPATASVTLENGQSQTMSQLQIGDQVQTILPDGSISYSAVKAFLDKKSTTVSMYKSIETSGNNTIHLSGKHFIYVRKGWTEKFKPIYADDVAIDDKVLVYGKSIASPENVINISDINMQGAYSPITMEGTIMVNEVLASCYAHSPDHDLAHFWMTPLRWFPDIMQCIFGEDIEFPVYVKIIYDLGNSMMPQSSTF